MSNIQSIPGHYSGTWTLKSGIATFTNFMGESANYNRRSLEAAVQNVRKNRSLYLTDEAYMSELVSFENGLKLFY
ncbi:MAG: hypothetical protein WD512_18460 [Candidatus Paceibacterota bacterium]